MRYPVIPNLHKCMVSISLSMNFSGWFLGLNMEERVVLYTFALAKLLLDGEWGKIFIR